MGDVEETLREMDAAIRSTLLGLRSRIDALEGRAELDSQTHITELDSLQVHEQQISEMKKEIENLYVILASHIGEMIEDKQEKERNRKIQRTKKLPLRTGGKGRARRR
jgi:hypothetical protein